MPLRKCFLRFWVTSKVCWNFAYFFLTFIWPTRSHSTLYYLSRDKHEHVTHALARIYQWNLFMFRPILDQIQFHLLCSFYSLRSQNCICNFISYYNWLEMTPFRTGEFGVLLVITTSTGCCQCRFHRIFNQMPVAMICTMKLFLFFDF